MRGGTIAAALVAGWSLLPIYWVVNLSFQRRYDIYTIPAFILPPRATSENYLRAIGVLKASVFGSDYGTGQVPQFLAGVGNSGLVATLVMLLTLLLCIPAGYAFARFTFPLRTSIFFIILFARSLPPISSSIPYYQFYKQVGLLGTIPGLVLVHLTLTVPLTTWVLSGFFSSLPVELEREARVDGCSRLRMFRSVLIPVAAPGLAAVAILAWLTSWNEFIFALLLGFTNDLYTVSPAIAGPLIGGGSANPELSTAFMSISLIPAIAGASILQRYMTRLKIVDPLTFGAPA